MTPRLAFAVAMSVATTPATADPLRLRGDALATTPAPAGLLTLQAGGPLAPNLSAEAVVWMGAAPGDGDSVGDALVIAIRARLPGDRASLRLGRFVATAGALRPIHLDGLAGRVRLPRRVDVEVFGGVPVARSGAQMWDWIVGGRVSRRLGDWGAVGVGALERREEGRLAAKELGVDAGAALGRRSDLAGRLAVDLVTPSLAEVRIAGTRRVGALRVEARVAQRSPAHLVPATSLFSVLGDVAAEEAGVALTWRAAPRLDLLADVAGRRTDSEIAPELVARATLRLDDRGSGAIGTELRRSGPWGAGWIGARGIARVPLPIDLTLAAELELVRPDTDRGGGSLWPWGLLALTGRRGSWDAAIAVEASASPEYEHRVDVLAQLGRRWGGAVSRIRIAAVALVLAGLAACAGVLGLRRDGKPEMFPHRAHLLVGVSCPTCHVGIETARDTGPLHSPDQATCLGCHATPHDSRSCLGCHADSFAAGAAAEAKAHLRFDHQSHLAGAAQGNCARCHQAVAESDAPLRPRMATCWSCHEHDRARDLRACGGCHVDLVEEGTLPESHLAHDADFAASHGTVASSSADLCESCHQESFCAGCHGVTAPVVPARLRFADPFAASVHRAGFASRHAEEARAAPGACSSCHAPDRCASCHRDRGIAGTDAASPHPRGWVGITAAENDHGRAARIDPASCASCHGGAGEALCVSCHRVGGVGGDPHPAGWSSRQPLSALPCRLCHTPGSM